MAWRNLAELVRRVRQALTPDHDEDLPADRNAIESLLEDLIRKARLPRDRGRPDLNSFFVAYGAADPALGAERQTRVGVERFLEDLACCLIRMEPLGRLADARVDNADRRLLDHFAHRLQLSHHYSWVAQRLQTIFNHAGVAVRQRRQQQRMAALEPGWVFFWRHYHTRIPTEFQNLNVLMRFVSTNWAHFKGNQSLLGTHATALQWGVNATPGTAWYRSLDVADAALPREDRETAVTESLRNFWSALYNRQQDSFADLCTAAFQIQTIIRSRRGALAGAGSGSSAIDRLNEAFQGTELANARQRVNDDLSHWFTIVHLPAPDNGSRQLQDGLRTVQRRQLEALQTCHHDYWSHEREVPVGELFRRAGFRRDPVLGAAGDQSLVVEPR